MTVSGRVYRAEVVGSMLRPPELMDARAKMRAGELSPERYRVLEDRAVDAALMIQESAGVDVVTDGEQRRDIFLGFFLSGMSGLSRVGGNTVRFRGATPDDNVVLQIPFSVTERIQAKVCPALAEFEYSRARTDKPVKVTLPSPSLIAGFWSEASEDAYPNPFDLMEDATAVVAGWMRELSDAGCGYIQIDAPDLAEIYANSDKLTKLQARGVDPDRFKSVATDLVGSLGDVSTPGTTKGMHVCKGNGTRSWLAEGGYGPFAEQVFQRAAGFDVFHLEYDDERSGDFAPLAKLPDDKVAVLGLVSTKWTDLEDPAALKARILEASRFHPIEQLAVATQCGFASAGETAQARKVTTESQAAKLELVASVAHEVWS